MSFIANAKQSWEAVKNKIIELKLLLLVIYRGQFFLYNVLYDHIKKFTLLKEVISALSCG